MPRRPCSSSSPRPGFHGCALGFCTELCAPSPLRSPPHHGAFPPAPSSPSRFSVGRCSARPRPLLRALVRSALCSPSQPATPLLLPRPCRGVLLAPWCRAGVSSSSPWRSCARVGPSLVSPMTRGFLREFCCVQLHLFPSSAACFSPLLVAPSCSSPCPHCSLLLLCLPSLQARRRSSPAAPLARLCAPRAPLPELTQIRQCLPQLDSCRAALRLTGVSPVRARSGRVRPCLFRRAWSLTPCARRCELVSHRCLVTETPTPTPSSMVTTLPNAFVAWPCVVVDLVRCRVLLFLMRIAQ
ncbi:uncharacterized protein LOC100381932 [Zea mays]|uniref:Uncharacterized protein n=1 Tax=Zea mays TaxID=4577 RepID=C0P2X1_MAIZE|nr:uncharacterized protein LOC100381932 [Zea mays]ACN27337.1 unknown [Zea mays]|eukprot:NP_001168178.1 uncharacterized protein LOC100381932 [Zea mays]